MSIVKKATLKAIVDGQVSELAPKTTGDQIYLDEDTKLSPKIAEIVTKINDISAKLPFDFGVDENGKCGYYKPGEEKLTLFGSGSYGSLQQVDTYTMNYKLSGDLLLKEEE